MGYWTTTLQKGSQGDEVKKWQEYLNTQGYGLSVDGVFGDKTYNATVDYQKANGLGVDGIVGKNTWGKAGFKNYNDLTTPTAAPTIEPTPTLPTLTYTPYDKTTEGETKKGAADAALEYLNNYGNHTWANEATYNEWLNKKLNREDFSYDLNSDALYQQYAEQYRNMGKLAMEDAIGQASAMTGGYGNSYAASVGNQAYQAYLGELNEKALDFYQLALNKYLMEGEQIDSNLASLGEDYNRSLNDWQTGYGLLMDKYNIANSDYYNSASLYDTEQNAINSVAQQNYQNAFANWEANNTNSWNQAKWEENGRLSELEQFWTEKDYELKKNQSTTSNVTSSKNTSTSNTSTSNNTKNHKEELNGYSSDTGKADAWATTHIKKESEHDTIARDMYGPYTTYVAIMIAQSNLSDEEKMYLITKYGVTEDDIQNAIDKGYDIK